MCAAVDGEVSAQRENRRSGYPQRRWDTRAGTIELACKGGRTMIVHELIAAG